MIERVVSGRRRALWAVLLALIAVVLVFFVIRLVVDVPNLATGTVSGPASFERRYALHPTPAHVHIVPGVVFLLGAPFQLSRRFRRRHLVLHRRLGRILLGLFQLAGLISIPDNTGTEWFGVAFWLAFVLHAAVAEVYLKQRPSAPGRATRPLMTNRVDERP